MHDLTLSRTGVPAETGSEYRVRGGASATRLFSCCFEVVFVCLESAMYFQIDNYMPTSNPIAISRRHRLALSRDQVQVQSRLSKGMSSKKKKVQRIAWPGPESNRVDTHVEREERATRYQAVFGWLMRGWFWAKPHFLSASVWFSGYRKPKFDQTTFYCMQCLTRRGTVGTQPFTSILKRQKKSVPASYQWPSPESNGISCMSDYMPNSTW
jgi:hypothetical protein